MYCPNCASPTSTDQKFCRSCGLNLSQTLKSASDSSSSNILDESLVKYFSQRGRMRRWGFITFWGGIVLAALISIIGGAIRNLNRPFGNFIEDIAGIGGMICVVGLGMMIYSLFLPKTPVQSQPPSATALPQSGSTMPVSFGYRRDPVSSITEHTTELLDNGDPQSVHHTPARQRE